MLRHFDAVGRELFDEHRREFILDAPGIDLAAGSDDGAGAKFIGQDAQQRLRAHGLLGLYELFFFDHKRNHARAAELVTRLHGGVSMARGDHQLVDGVYGVKPRTVDGEKARARRRQLNFALFDLAAVHAV